MSNALPLMGKRSTLGIIFQRKAAVTPKGSDLLIPPSETQTNLAKHGGNVARIQF